MTTADRGTPFIRLSILACASLLVHGYHLGSDDAAIYVPGIKHAFDPDLYHFGAQFFMYHARLSVFPGLIGGAARMLHIPIDAAILITHWLGLVLLLLAAWRLLSLCFESPAARWGGVALLAATLGVPVAGTALSLADPYVTARTLSAPFTLLSLTAWLAGRRGRALWWLAATVAVHPQMGAYCGAFLVCLEFMRRQSSAAAALMPVSAAALPAMFDLHPASGAASEALHSRTFFFLYNWAWYEWLGVVAPLALLTWAVRRRFRSSTAEFTLLVRALVPFGVCATLFGAVLSSSAYVENLSRLQPMRAFHLIYLVFFCLLGGLLGDYLLRRATWRWAVLFLPLACGMFFVARADYASSPHIEWPGARPSNPWLAAFYWIRGNTPKSAVFALPPDYMSASGEDAHGFRAIAERSVLADSVKDSGAVAMFPELASEWKAQTAAQTGLPQFGRSEFRLLAQRYPVDWVVMHRGDEGRLNCPYVNSALAVCRIAPNMDEAPAVNLALAPGPAAKSGHPAPASR